MCSFSGLYVPTIVKIVSWKIGTQTQNFNHGDPAGLDLKYFHCTKEVQSEIWRGNERLHPAGPKKRLDVK